MTRPDCLVLVCLYLRGVYMKWGGEEETKRDERRKKLKIQTGHKRHNIPRMKAGPAKRRRRESKKRRKEAAHVVQMSRCQCYSTWKKSEEKHADKHRRAGPATAASPERKAKTELESLYSKLVVVVSLFDVSFSLVGKKTIKFGDGLHNRHELKALLYLRGSRRSRRRRERAASGIYLNWRVTCSCK